jgi:hypothetical protein
VNLPEKDAGCGQRLTSEKMKECVSVKPQVVAEIGFLERTGADHYDTPGSFVYVMTKTACRGEGDLIWH